MIQCLITYLYRINQYNRVVLNPDLTLLKKIGLGIRRSMSGSVPRGTGLSEVTFEGVGSYAGLSRDLALLLW